MRDNNDTTYKLNASESGDSRERLDDFWEIDMLVPKMHTAPRRAPGATETTEISFGREGSENQKPDAVEDVPLNLNAREGEVLVRHFVPQHGTPLSDSAQTEAIPVISYRTDGSLVHRVEVFPWVSRYHYYRDFCADAAKYLHEEPRDGDPIPEEVSFFSYVPQYSQLNRKQLSYYFYWRREFRRGNILKIDESYLYLYVYELLNTAGYETPPEEGLRMLYRLFRTYGRKNPKLSRHLIEWIVDYSLIFRFAVPEKERLEPDFYRTYASTLKEFYISSPGGGTAGFADLLLRFCSSYDYKKSHFYTGNNCLYFDRYLPGALAAVVAQYSTGTQLFTGTGMRDSHMVRNAFDQALCSYRIRYRIEVDYASFSRSHEMRYLVSDILKYTENRLRGYLGIKSRLTVYSVTTEIRKCIDRYCDENFPRKTVENRPAKQEEIPVYEKLYDLPETPLSICRAAEIELDSWETTRRLTEAFSDEEETDTAVSPKRAEAPPEAVESDRQAEAKGAEKNGVTAVLGDLSPFAVAAYRGDVVAQREFCRERGLLPDTVADQINELAADAFGDILLLDEGEGYFVIEDYRSLFEPDGM